MAISYPRALPSPAYFAQTNVAFDRPQALTMANNAANFAADLGDGVWRCHVRSVDAVPRSGIKTWRAWLASLQGARKTFLMTDPDYAAPAAHPDGTGWGSPTVSAFSQANGTISMTGMTAGAIITPGDRLHIIYATSSHYAYHEVTEGGTVDGSGNLTITVEGPIRTGLTTSRSVVFASPSFEAALVPGTVETPDALGGQGAFEFQAFQVVRD